MCTSNSDAESRGGENVEVDSEQIRFKGRLVIVFRRFHRRFLSETDETPVFHCKDISPEIPKNMRE